MIAQRYYFYVRPVVEEEIEQADDMWAGTISRIVGHAEKLHNKNEKGLSKMNTRITNKTDDIKESIGKVEDTQLTLKREVAAINEKVDANTHAVNKQLVALTEMAEKLAVSLGISEKKEENEEEKEGEQEAVEE